MRIFLIAAIIVIATMVAALHVAESAKRFVNSKFEVLLQQ